MRVQNERLGVMGSTTAARCAGVEGASVVACSFMDVDSSGADFFAAGFFDVGFAAGTGASSWGAGVGDSSLLMCSR
jgi:hypothetical protein